MRMLTKVLVLVVAIFTLFGCANERGRVKSKVETTTSKEGTVVSEIQTLYDKNGNFIEIKSEEWIATFTYEGNRCIQSKMDSFVLYYEYDGDLLIKIETFENDELVNTVTHSYVDDNRVQSTTVDKNGIVLDVQKMVYDSNNVLLSITGTSENGNTREITNQTDENGNISETLNYANGELFQTEQNEYSNNALIKKKIMVEGSNDPMTLDYMYDDEGKIIEQKLTSHDGSTTDSIITYTYTYY